MRKEQSAGIMIFRKENNVNKILLLKSYDFWDFPKGGIEKNENKLEAAIREVKEETGITNLNFKWGKIYYETEPFGINKKVVYYFIAESPEEKVEMGINPLLGRAEHDEYHWFEIEEAKKVVVDRIKRAIDWAIKRIDNRF